MNTKNTSVSPQDSILERYLDYWPTSTGKAFVGERAVMHGKDLLHDLVDLDWLTLHFFSITGRTPDPNKLKVMMIGFTGCSYPDPRIWNNRIAALAGTARSTASLAVGAATAVSEATIYGHRANKKCIHMLLRAFEHTQRGDSLDQFITDELAAKRKFYGYGRPMKNIDERIPPTIELIQAYDLYEDPYIELCFELDRLLRERKNLAMNITGLCAGIAATLGLSPFEYHLFLTSIFCIGFTPCYKDATEKPEGALFPIPCERIQYTGPEARAW